VRGPDGLTRVAALYGVKGKENAWINSFLSERVQKVRWGKTLSTARKVPWGTPQGSCLSPLPFLIYTADLDEYLEVVEAYSYADNTTTFASGKEEQEVRPNLEKDAVNLLKYMSANRLVANADKTQFTIANGCADGGPIRVGDADIRRAEELSCLACVWIRPWVFLSTWRR
jgi:hypothetical protein